MKTATKSEFAQMRGVSPSSVTHWKTKGLLVLTEEGKVDVEASERLLAGRPENYRGGQTKPAPAATSASEPKAPRPARRAPTPRPGESPEEAAERIVVEEGVAPYEHAEAVRIKENYLALLRRLEFDLKSGAVVPIDTVIAGVVEQYARVRNKLLNLPTRVAPRAAVLKSAEEVRALVEAEVILALQELTLDGEGHVSLADLRDSLRERFGTVH